jgi:hypothetical protein
MSLPETLIALVPMLLVAVGAGLIQRQRVQLGAALVAASAAVAVLAAALGNWRPFAAWIAWSFLIVAFAADAKERRGLALSCFSAGFLGLIVTAMYT